jgi:predicted nucleic acid-binding protein
MSRIFWDTNLFIYLFERNPEFYEVTAALRRRMGERKDELITSAMTLGEIQVGRRRSKELALADRYRDAVRRTCTVLPFDEAASDIYAQLRENPAIKPPDAIQLSCAAAAGVELFITNDIGLHKLKIPGIHFVAPLMRVPI